MEGELDFGLDFAMPLELVEVKASNSKILNGD
jgi:hypothetical protein